MNAGVNTVGDLFDGVVRVSSSDQSYRRLRILCLQIGHSRAGNLGFEPDIPRFYEKIWKIDKLKKGTMHILVTNDDGPPSNQVSLDGQGNIKANNV